jgi:two-component system chemotaxis response regulator CheY
MKKVLVRDDDPIMGHVCQRLLGRIGLTVEVATDGSKGLERVSAFQPDAVLLDVMMPKINGIEVLKAIRAQEQFRALPVIVFTNACIPALIDQVSKAGATHILDKSKFNPVAVTELLRGVLALGPEGRAETNSLAERVERLH